MRRTLLVLLPLLASGSELAAQHRVVVPGDEVQVRAPALHPVRFRGEVIRYMGDTLAVRESKSGEVITMPLADVRFLAVNEGMDRRRSFRRSLAAGAFVGTAVGLVLGPLIASGAGEGTDFVTFTAMSGAGGLLAGSTLGAAVGGLFPRDHWQRFNMAARPPRPCGDSPCPATEVTLPR